MSELLQVYSTSGVPVPRKAETWNAILGRLACSLQALPRDPRHFDGTLIRRRVGPITLFEVHCAGVHIRHRGETAGRRGMPSFQLLMPVHNEFVITHGSRPAATVGAGSLCLLDRAERYEMVHGDGLRTLGVDIPRSLLENWLPHATRHAGAVLQPDSGACRVLGGLLRTLGSELHAAGPTVQLPAALARSIAGFIAAAFADPARVPAQGGIRARLAAYREYVDSRLGDGEFRPADVARHFHVSARYVRMVFESAGEPLSVYLLRRRHERAARMLRSADWRAHTIMDIAVECGFNSASHFGQSFRDHFGSTPTQYRQRSAGKAGAGW
jgi:AraC-like DNA-binding protein